jgi:hypothetical protein
MNKTPPTTGQTLGSGSGPLAGSDSFMPFSLSGFVIVWLLVPSVGGL